MIDDKEALTIARKRAAEKGWEFAEPVMTVYNRNWWGGPGKYEIESGVAGPPPHARFTISARTGAIRRESFS
ncbi:MAG: hypothetical protein V4459_07865 [Pseudomonadota bacterium]